MIPVPSPAALLAALVVAGTGAATAQVRAASAPDGGEHWSFQRLPAAVPLPAATADATHPIDRFVRARLRELGIASAPPADPATLLRRAHLTLTGLPPDLADLDAFLREPSPAAFERAVDALLASPRHAEHMASYWLDAARYADTYGYQSDVHREVWPWRDWVIRAFADNLPYDRFVTWQLAGDLLPDATTETRLATCFNRLHRQTNEGGSVEEEFRVDYVADRVNTFGTAFLGLTVECARCHDHKFDPLSQRDYYRLFAFFDDIDESGLYSHFTDAVPTPVLDLPTPEQQQALAAATTRVAAAEAALAAWDAQVGAATAAAFEGWLEQEVPPVLEPPVGSFSFEELGPKGELANGGSSQAAGRADAGAARAPGRVGNALELDGETALTFPGVADFTRDDPFTIALWLRPAERHERAVVWHRSRAWTDAGSRGYELLLEEGRPSAALIHFWPGDAIRVRAAEPLPVGSWSHVAVSYDGSGRAAGLRIWVDGQRAPVEIVRDHLVRTIQGGGANALTIGARFRDRGLRGGTVDELQVFDRELAEPEVAELAAPGSWAALWRRRHAGGDARRQLALVFTASRPERTRLVAELNAARRARSGVVDAIRAIMTMAELPEPRTAHVLLRGRYDAPGEPVEPGTPAALPPLPVGERVDRLALARWLTAPDHPLTARVAVNRIWAMHFGRGLVATPEDFGCQGARPEYPDLLDWLARWFVDSGWDQRALHRLILTSATWQQSSACDAAARSRDPANELLARGPRFRLRAEVIRDSALFVGGALVEQIGGPPVRPWQPDGLWREKSGATYVRTPGEASRRRSLYTYWKRTSAPPGMTLLDANERDVCVVRRESTTTPLQTLLLWNDPQYVDAAQALATRALREGGPDTTARVTLMFRLVTSHHPDTAELAMLTAAWDTERSAFAATPTGATALLAAGDLPIPADLDPLDLATATALASTLLSLSAPQTLR
ncbi:MAG: DUF1553 domain-containing protein [Planctomycetes bacterium]|nr:DUF1553 domain-containing protein [Planctomycetota bacterium]